MKMLKVRKTILQPKLLVLGCSFYEFFMITLSFESSKNVALNEYTVTRVKDTVYLKTSSLIPPVPSRSVNV